MRTRALILAVAIATVVRVDVPAGQAPAPAVEWFLQAASENDREAAQALKQIAVVWKDAYASMIYDLARLIRGPRTAAAEPDFETAALFDDPETPTSARRPTPGLTLRQEPPARMRLLRFLGQQTRQRFGSDLAAWQRWIWTLPYDPHPEYARFKALAYRGIDPAFERFFPPGVRSLIRLDEVDWGGVRVNGIPPLYYPKHVPAREASYLRDGNVVFGIAVNGQARAYPKRILAWHEMALDKIGGDELTIVYCTLCGTVIPYESIIGGRHFRFGTSGLLYRSNKLMFDEETDSLWSTLEGKPVIGALVETGLELRSRPVVTTTWEEWKREHPDTTVLSLDTGFRRDYSEGAAYRDYFGTDSLMFQVSRTDMRLRNKAEVLVMVLPAMPQQSPRPIAIAADFLKQRPVFQFESGANLVVITTPKGANRVYRAGDHKFDRILSDGKVADADGRAWSVTEEALMSHDEKVRLPRQPAHRAFWFGWYAQFPNTTLIK